MKPKDGFTLVEVLIVVVIIALLIAIIMPSLTPAKELSRRAVCSSHLHAVARACTIYATDNRSFLPVVATSNAAYNLIGHNRNLEEVETDEGDDPDIADNTRTMFKLMNVGWPKEFIDEAALMISLVSPDSFVCPSAREDTSDPTKEDPQYGFSHWTHVSYSFQNQKPNPGADGAMPVVTTMSHSGSKAIMADRNPLMKWGEDTGSPEYSKMIPSDEAPCGNSHNHGKNRGWSDGDPDEEMWAGQNVLYLDGHVKFCDTPNVGVGGDNIYTRQGGDEGGCGAVPPSEGDDRPVDRDDSHLVP